MVNQATTTRQEPGLVTGLFSDRESAESAYRSLRLRGYTDDEINVIMSDATRDKYYVKDPHTEIGTKAASELLKRLGCDGKTVLVDVTLDENLSRSVRNIPGVSFVRSGRVTARDVLDARRVVVTKSALETLQEALG